MLLEERRALKKNHRAMARRLKRRTARLGSVVKLGTPHDSMLPLVGAAFVYPHVYDLRNLPATLSLPPAWLAWLLGLVSFLFVDLFPRTGALKHRRTEFQAAGPVNPAFPGVPLEALAVWAVGAASIFARAL